MRDTTHFEPWTGRGAKAWATLKAEDRVRAPYAILSVLLGAPARDAPEHCSTIWFLQEQDKPRALFVVRDHQPAKPLDLPLAVVHAGEEEQVQRHVRAGRP